MDGAVKKPLTYTNQDGVEHCEYTGRRVWHKLKTSFGEPAFLCEHCGKSHTRLNFRPHGQRVLVLLDRKQGEFGHVLIPDEYQRQQQKGTVVAVGRMLNRDESYCGLEIQVGQRVVFGKWNGVEIEAREECDRHRTWYLLRVDPDLRYDGDKRVHMDECYGIITDEDGEMRVPD